MRLTEKPKDRAEDAKTKYLYKKIRYDNNVNQASTASQLTGN